MNESRVENGMSANESRWQAKERVSTRVYISEFYIHFNGTKLIGASSHVRLLGAVALTAEIWLQTAGDSVSI